MTNQNARVALKDLQVEKDHPLTEEELTALRRSVGWPVKGDHARIIEEGLFHISARLSGRLVGFLHVVGNPHCDLLIHDVCVHPDYQGQGVGTRLVEAALKVCRGLKPQGVNVLFEGKNRSFFERFGFRIMYGGYMDAPSLQSECGKGKAG